MKTPISRRTAMIGGSASAIVPLFPHGQPQAAVTPDKEKTRADDFRRSLEFHAQLLQNMINNHAHALPEVRGLQKLLNGLPAGSPDRSWLIEDLTRYARLRDRCAAGTAIHFCSTAEEHSKKVSFFEMLAGLPESRKLPNSLAAKDGWQINTLCILAQQTGDSTDHLLTEIADMSDAALWQWILAYADARSVQMPKGGVS